MNNLKELASAATRIGNWLREKLEVHVGSFNLSDYGDYGDHGEHMMRIFGNRPEFRETLQKNPRHREGDRKSSMSVTSGGARKRTGGPHVPEPLLT